MKKPPRKPSAIRQLLIHKDVIYAVDAAGALWVLRPDTTNTRVALSFIATPVTFTMEAPHADPH